MKNINEELNHMKYLFGYKKGVVISEQKIINENIIFEQDKTILDLDYDKISLEEQVRKKINVGADVRTGNKHPRAWGKHGGQAGFDLNIDWYNEVSVNLQTSSDLLAKMEKELKSSEWEKIPYEIKIQLAAGFFDSINDGLNSDYVKNLSRKQKRDYKKFFKKAQRWRFQMDKVSKIFGDNSKDKVVITIPAENDSAMEVYNNSLTTINELNKNNSDMDTIMSKVCNYIGIEEETTKDGRKIQKAVSWYSQKAPLQTVIMYEEQPPRKYIEKAQGSVTTKDTVEVDIPAAPTNFAAGKAEIPSSYINDVVENIYSQLMSKVFEANMADYGLQKKTGAEIVKDFQNGQGDGIILEFIDTISSASNTWSKNEILDFTHNNDGTKVKEFDQLDQKGNNKKNSALAGLRNGNLTNGVIAGLKRMPGIIVDINNVEYSQDIRVTDTGGKIDEDPVRAEGKPNKGQYAGFKLGFYADITDTKVQPQQDRLTATYGQRVITLKWVGKKDLPGINIELVWEYKPGVKNKILKKNIFTGQLQPGGRRWSKLRGYK